MTLSFRTSPATLVVGVAIWLILLTISAMKLFTTPAGHEFVLFVGAVAVLLLITGAVSLEFSLERLRKHLEPKTGTVSYSYAGGSVGACATGKSRDELTHALVHSIAPHLVHRMDAEQVGGYIRGVLNEVLGAAGENSASAARLAEQIQEARATTALYASLQASADGMTVGAQSPSEVPEAGSSAKQAHARSGHKCLTHQVADCQQCDWDRSRD